MVNGLYCDMVLVNGKIITVNGRDEIAEAVAVTNGMITKVGSTEAVSFLVGDDTLVIDLNGRAVLPGLTDAHVHMVSDAAKAADPERLDCRDLYHPEIRSIEDLLNRIRVYASKREKGKWIQAEASPMQPFRMEDRRFPDKNDLDTATTEYPVAITFGAHVTVANTLALRLANITRDTPDPVGGWIEKDDAGEPTGILREKARPLVLNLVDPGGRESNEDYIKRGLPIPEMSRYTYNDMKEGLELACQRCLEKGCTTVHDVVTSADQIRAYQEMLAEGKLHMRINLLVRIFESQIRAESLLNLGLLSGFGNDWLKIGSAKISVDGGLTGCNAAFYEPYLHEPDNSGVIRVPQETLNDLVSRFNKAGMQLAIHAMGDRAFDMVLTAYEKALSQFPRTNHRHRIEHGPANFLCTPERTRKMKELGIEPVPNIGLFLYYTGDTLLEVLGPKRMEDAFPFKRLINEGFRLANGTDAPGYIPVDPLREISVCVTRKTWAGQLIAPDESISVLDAIRIHTINAAYAEFAEEKKGSIEQGKLADLIVLSRDPLTIPPEEIRQILVDYTIVDGRIVYERKQ
ncbi:amidohydrolase [Candidatus Bathyarchaeota archaeon]|nr:amidohydrolase [Candidatus Bathyarchaeota archaeon]